MELRQLRYFQAAAEELHFQRAARRINLSQPALSHQIKRLEEEVGVVLIDRSRNHVTLTPAGTALLARAREILDACDKALQEAREIGGAEPDVLRIGYVDFLNLKVIAHSIAGLRVARPDISVEQFEMPTAEVYAALKERNIDIGFGVLPAPYPTLVSRKIVEGHWSLVVPPDHSFAAQAELPLTALKDQPLIIFDRALNPALYDSWLARFAAAGFAPRIVFDTKQVQTALNMVRDGLGLFVVASYIVAPLPRDLTGLRLTGFDNSIAIGAAWHEDNRTRVLQDYLACFRKVLEA